MRLRLTVAGENLSTLLEKLNAWNASIVSRDDSGVQLSVGRSKILAVSVHVEGDTHVDYDDHEDMPSILPKDSTDSVLQLREKIRKQTITAGKSNAKVETKQNKCSTCNAILGDSKQYRDHFKSDWHKHNLKRPLPCAGLI